jgi:hypothetical protein
MAKRIIPTSAPNLLDIIEEEEIKEHIEDCPHRRMKRTLTIWPGETFERMTMTCELCGKVRGRYPNE